MSDRNPVNDSSSGHKELLRNFIRAKKGVQRKGRRLSSWAIQLVSEENPSGGAASLEDGVTLRQRRKTPITLTKNGPVKSTAIDTTPSSSANPSAESSTRTSPRAAQSAQVSGFATSGNSLRVPQSPSRMAQVENAELEKLRQTVAEQESQLGNYREEVHRLESEFVTEVESLEGRILELQTENERLQHSQSEASRKSESSEEDAAQIKTLRSMITNLKRENSQLKESLEEVREEFEEYKTNMEFDVTDLKVKTDEAERKVIEVENLLQTSKNSEKALKDRVEDMRIALIEADEDLKTSEEKAMRYSEQYELAVEELDSERMKVVKMKPQVRDQKIEIERLKQELKNSEEQRETAEEHITEKDAKLVQNAKDMNDAQKEIKALQLARDRANELLKKTKAELQEREATCTNLRSDVEHRQKTIDEKNSQIEKLLSAKQKSERREEQLRVEKTKLEQLRGELDRSNAELEERCVTLQNTCQFLKRTEDDLLKSRRAFKLSEKHREQLAHEVQHLRSASKESAQTLRDAAKRIDELELQLTATEARLHTREEELAESVGERKVERERLRRVEERWRVHGDVLERIRGELRAVMEWKSDVDDLLPSLQDMVEDQERDLEDMRRLLQDSQLALHDRLAVLNRTNPSPNLRRRDRHGDDDDEDEIRRQNDLLRKAACLLMR